MRKLSSYSKNHSLLQALTEYDRLIKSNYFLEYIDDENLRSYVQRALNRGDAYHQLRRIVAAVNRNRFRGGSDSEIDVWNECCPATDKCDYLFQFTCVESFVGTLC